jgi:hypothetical protein
MDAFSEASHSFSSTAYTWVHSSVRLICGPKCDVAIAGQTSLENISALYSGPLKFQREGNWGNIPSGRPGTSVSCMEVTQGLSSAH